MGAADRRFIHLQQTRCPQLRQQHLVQAGQTPASVQSRRRRQAVTPLQPTCSAGTSRQLTLLHST